MDCSNAMDTTEAPEPSQMTYRRGHPFHGLVITRALNIFHPYFYEYYRNGVQELLFLQHQRRRDTKSTEELNANEKLMYHAVAISAFEDFISNPFDERTCLGGRFGRGIYFNDSAVDAAKYLIGQGRTDTECYVLVCRVCVGEAKELGTNYDNSLFKQPSGFDSIHGNMLFGTGYVVYRDDRALIVRAIRCRLDESKP